MRPSKFLALALTGTSLLALAGHADAQTTSAETSTGAQLEEIVVTAQRREQRLQDVPISVSAYSEATLQAQSITDTLDLAKLTPTLVIGKNVQAAVPWLRGVGSVSSGFGNDLPVAVYLDGFVLPTPAAGIFSLNNIQRIEVLKGPQGTLFGRNTPAGVVQVVTKDPSAEPEFDVSVGYGNYETASGSFYASGPIATNLGASFGVTGSRQGEGWGRNVVTGREAFKTDQYSLTGKLKWAPSEATTVTLSGFYDNRTTGVGLQYGIVPGSYGTDGTPFLGRYTIANGRDEEGDSDQYLFGLKIEHDLGFAKLVSMTGAGEVRSTFGINLSGQPGSYNPVRPATEAEADGRGKFFTQELQLLSPDDAPFNWIVGLFYLDSTDSLNQVVHGTCAGLTAASCIGAPPIFYGARMEARSYAVFGQAEFNLAEKLRLTTGLRYTRDEKDIGDSYAAPAPGYPNSLSALPPSQPPRPGLPSAADPDGFETDKTWDKATWRLALDYKITQDVMAFASYNRGYKSGTYAFTSFANPPSRPEVLDAFEVGVKSTWLGNRLLLNAAAYYYDYKDIQLRTLAPPAPPGFAILYNAAAATIKGLDVDIQYVASDNLNLNASFAFLDAKYDQFSGGSCSLPAARTATVLGGNVAFTCNPSGNRMLRAPKFSGSVGFTYTIPTEFGDFLLAATDSYTGDFFFEVSNRVKQPAYHNISASVTWKSPSEKYEVQLWGKNLADEFIYAALFESTTDNYSPSDPLTYGVRFSAHF